MSDTWGGTAHAQQRGGGLVASTAAGIVAGLVGAIIWAVISKVTEREIGFVALGVGFLVGTAMALTAGRNKSLPIIGAVIALVSCLAGKFLAVVFVAASEFGTSIPSAFSQLLKVPDLTWAVYKSTFGAMDVLFLALAAYEGYQLTRAAVNKAHAPAPAQAPDAGPAAAYYPQAGPGQAAPETTGTPAARDPYGTPPPPAPPPAPPLPPGYGAPAASYPPPASYPAPSDCGDHRR